MAGPAITQTTGTTAAEAAAKLERYTTFAETTLEPALASVQATAAQLTTEREDAALKVRLEEMVKAAEQGSTTMELLTDLGSECWVTATVPDTSLVSVDLGLGKLYLQLTPAEGAAYCAKRDAVLATRAKSLEAKAQGLRQQLVVVQSAMQDVLAGRADAMLTH